MMVIPQHKDLARVKNISFLPLWPNRESLVACRFFFTITKRDFQGYLPNLTCLKFSLCTLLCRPIEIKQWTNASSFRRTHFFPLLLAFIYPVNTLYTGQITHCRLMSFLLVYSSFSLLEFPSFIFMIQVKYFEPYNWYSSSSKHWLCIQPLVIKSKRISMNL